MSTINLLPEDYLHRRAQQRANLLCLILFSIVMAGIIGAAAVQGEDDRKVRQVSDEVNKEYEDASRMIAQLEQLEGTKKKVLQKAEIAADLRERVPRSYLLASVTNSLPKGTGVLDITLKTTMDKPAAARRITKFSRNSPKDKPTQTAKPAPKPMDSSLEVTGMAQNDTQVAEFIRRMSQDPLYQSVDLAYSQETEYEKVKIREFKVVIQIKKDADLDTDVTTANSSKTGDKSSNVKA